MHQKLYPPLNLFKVTKLKWRLVLLFSVATTVFYTLYVFHLYYSFKPYLSLFNHLSHTTQTQNSNTVKFVNDKQSPTTQSHSHTSPRYLINTETCRIPHYPLFDPEILVHYKNLTGTKFDCDKNQPPFPIRRVNFTWIHIRLPNRTNASSSDAHWQCNAQEIMRIHTPDDSYTTGPNIGPLGEWTNFANNLTVGQLGNFPGNESGARWDSVLVTCRLLFTNDTVLKQYTRVVPLVQHYLPQHYQHRPESSREGQQQQLQQPRISVLLLGLDTCSRLNFERHMRESKRFLDSHGFIGMFGHHKVGENSYPNVMPMLTGQPHHRFFNDTGPKSFRFDAVPFVFKNFSRKGYLTTFIEDMSAWSFFSWKANGFVRQPTDYYLRPTNLVMDQEAYYSGACYQEQLGYRFLWDYVCDQLAAFKQRSQPHLTFAHVSTLTHHYFNHVAYADAPYRRLLGRLFHERLFTDTVILLYSDHSLRFGRSMNTSAAVFEARLPFLYVYVPDRLRLDGKDAAELRRILRVNRRRLTSHVDLYATLLHVLDGRPPDDGTSTLSRSLFREMPVNRTCAQAGIPVQYCLCNELRPMPIDGQIRRLSTLVVDHMNHILAPYANTCVPLEFGAAYRAFELVDRQSQQAQYRLIHLETRPNAGLFEVMVELEPDGVQLRKVFDINRLNLYHSQAVCVIHNVEIRHLCLCWSKYVKPKTTKHAANASTSVLPTTNHKEGKGKRLTIKEFLKSLQQ